MQPSAEIIDPDEYDDDRVYVEFTATFNGNPTSITGWPEAAEDLDLLGPGPKEANGIEVISETPKYYSDDEENIAGYTRVVLAFEDADRLSWASDRLYDKASERFEWGMSDASDVQDFAGAVPHPTEVSA